MFRFLNSGAGREPAFLRGQRYFAHCAMSLALAYSLLSGTVAAASLERFMVAQATGSVKTTLTPASAVTAGAQWRIDGGTWRTSGATATGIVAGTHTLTFKAVTGYKTPAALTVSVLAGQTATATADYIALGSVVGTILPAAAAAEGARWHVDSGTWQTSGTVLSNITVGSHTVSFKATTGWVTPAAVPITVLAGATSPVSGTYAPVGKVTVAILPTTLTTARWRLDGGTWRATGITLSNVAEGPHTVDFNTVAGWTSPAPIAFSVVHAQTSSLNGTYTQTGSVSVSISPSAAASAGAKWRLDGGAWNISGAVTANVAVGDHSITFSDVAGWLTPAGQTVTVSPNAVTSATGTYIGVGNVSATILPAAAVTAGAKWRLDGGALQNSGAVLSNIVEGAHTLSFSDVANWNTPATQTVTVLQGQTATASGTYTQTGKLSVQLLPSPATDEGAKWAVDGGVMNASGATLEGLTPGSHTLTFSSVAGWTSPTTATINVTAGQTASTTQVYKLTLGSYVMFANNDLGMHCMNQDFSELMILPPFNTVHAQVIRRGAEPQLQTSGVTINYRIPGNTTSVTKTNFWDYAPDLFGVALPADKGLTGNGLSGTMVKSTTNEANYVVTGVPVTQITDAGEDKPLQMAEFKAIRSGTQIARINTVMPVSWEISCNLCHTGGNGVTPFTDILQTHDRMHGTDLVNQKPVVCGSCHAQPPLGLAGAPGVSSLSSAMHTAHADRIPALGMENGCYACHPGVNTQCQRDIHREKGIVCTDCHGQMADVGNPARKSWQDEPKCGSCHQRSGFSFEEPGKLYRDSRGHHEVECWVCHGSPHAITPTITNEDNTPAMMVQGHAGVLDCVVCHINKPSDEFEHHL